MPCTPDKSCRRAAIAALFTPRRKGVKHTLVNATTLLPVKAMLPNSAVKRSSENMWYAKQNIAIIKSSTKPLYTQSVKLKVGAPAAAENQ